jgi:hypothetical protein
MHGCRVDGADQRILAIAIFILLARHIILSRYALDWIYFFVVDLMVRHQVRHQICSLSCFGLQTQFFSDICPMKVHGFFGYHQGFGYFFT